MSGVCSGSGVFALDEGILVKSLMLRGDAVIEKALAVARETSRYVKSKYVFSECRVEEVGDGYVTLNGVEFTSKILAHTLKDSDRVFPYFATCGEEVSEHTGGMTDLFDKYVSEKVEFLALAQARDTMRDKVKSVYGGHGISHINPGSIQDWSTLEMKKIDALLGDSPREMGIHILDSGMILPVRSVSGFMFVSEEEFHNCILCRRECPNRRAEFDEEAYVNSL